MYSDDYSSIVRVFELGHTETSSYKGKGSVQCRRLNIELLQTISVTKGILLNMQIDFFGVCTLQCIDELVQSYVDCLLSSAPSTTFNLSFKPLF